MEPHLTSCEFDGYLQMILVKLNMASRSKCTSTLHQSFFFICHILYEYDWHNECPKWSSNRLPFQSTRVYSRYVVLLWFLCSVVVDHCIVFHVSIVLSVLRRLTATNCKHFVIQSSPKW